MAESNKRISLVKCGLSERQQSWELASTSGVAQQQATSEPYPTTQAYSSGILTIETSSTKLTKGPTDVRTVEERSTSVPFSKNSLFKTASTGSTRAPPTFDNNQFDRLTTDRNPLDQFGSNSSNQNPFGQFGSNSSDQNPFGQFGSNSSDQNPFGQFGSNSSGLNQFGLNFTGSEQPCEQIAALKKINLFNITNPAIALLEQLCNQVVNLANQFGGGLFGGNTAVPTQSGQNPLGGGQFGGSQFGGSQFGGSQFGGGQFGGSQFGGSQFGGNNAEQNPFGGKPIIG